VARSLCRISALSDDGGGDDDDAAAASIFSQSSTGATSAAYVDVQLLQVDQVVAAGQTAGGDSQPCFID